MLSIAYLLWTRAPWPARHNRGLLLGSAIGAVFGFPLFLGFAVRHVDAAHAAVVTGLMPLATAVVAAVWLRQRPSIGFWACAVLGCALVTGYALVRSGGRVSAGDMLLLAAIASAAVSYVGGARLAGRGMTAEQVICWMLVACFRRRCRSRWCWPHRTPMHWRRRGRRRGWALVMCRWYRCGWAFSPGTGAWRWAARCG